MSVYEMLSKKYGQSLAWAKQMTGQVAERGAVVGLHFDFDRAAPTNTLDAHRLIHLAAKHGLEDQTEERLFAAHFTEGKQIGDPNVLQKLGVEIGLPSDEVRTLLTGNAFTSDVRQEEEEAHSLGIRGVPFFLFNRKYVVSGAQPVEAFLKTLRTAWNDPSSITDTRL